jgi:fluoride exporter
MVKLNLVGNIEKIILISTGAMLGANARYWLGIWAGQKWEGTYPIGTLLINVTGCLFLGLIMTMTSGMDPAAYRVRFLFAVGFLGAYTTFSTFTFESFNLLFEGAWMSGMFNLIGSMVLGVLAVGLGIWVGKLI